MSDDWRERKVTVKVARKILGKSGDRYSNKQLESTIKCLYEIADFFLRS